MGSEVYEIRKENGKAAFILKALCTAKEVAETGHGSGGRRGT